LCLPYVSRPVGRIRNRHFRHESKIPRTESSSCSSWVTFELLLTRATVCLVAAEIHVLSTCLVIPLVNVGRTVAVEWHVPAAEFVPLLLLPLEE
jgi:hypothetical protein